MCVITLDTFVESHNALLDVSRTGKIAQNQNPAGILRVIEVDLPDLKLTSASTTFWPESAPRIDGVIVCYDASDEQTFTHVEQLIR